MGEYQDKTKGKIKEVAGVATSNRTLEAEGKLDQAKGWVKGKFEELKQKAREGMKPESDKTYRPPE